VTHTLRRIDFMRDLIMKNGREMLCHIIHVRA
jgi:hypothetical protein